MTDLDAKKTEIAFPEPIPGDDQQAFSEVNQVLIKHASGYHDFDKRISVIEEQYAKKEHLERRINRLLWTIIGIGGAILGVLLTAFIRSLS